MSEIVSALRKSAAEASSYADTKGREAAKMRTQLDKELAEETRLRALAAEYTRLADQEEAKA